MKTNIFIPTKINVGFQNRRDTYSGKLAYVIYFDEKGKLRKETSWQNWRDKDIPNEIFDNEPTEGFVLNKKVGGVEESYYDVRKTYVRVYDPRGFEFEIQIPNLLWILENCNCIKGKGLEGQFVYGWDGKELVLVPVESPDYNEITEKNKIIHNNEFIKAKDLIIGATYENLNGEKYVYMGKFDNYEIQGNYYRDDRWGGYYQKGWEYPLDETWLEDKISGSSGVRYKNVNTGKCFFFIKLRNPDARYSYERETDSVITMKTVTRKFGKVVDEKCHERYIDFVDMLEHDNAYSYIEFDKSKIISLPYTDFCRVLTEHQVNYRYCCDFGYININGYLIRKGIFINKENKFYYEEEIPDGIDYTGRKKVKRIRKEFDSIEEPYQSFKPVYGEKYLNNGKLFRRENYYGSEE